MAFETYRLQIRCQAFRRNLNRVCHRAEALESLVQIYRERLPGCHIRICRRSLVFEMVGDVIYVDDLPNQLAEAAFTWDVHTTKTVVRSDERFEAMVKEIKEKTEAAKTDDSIICMEVFLEDRYEL